MPLTECCGLSIHILIYNIEFVKIIYYEEKMSGQPLSTEDKTIKSKSFAKAVLTHHIFTACSFNGCDFSESLLYNAQFNICTFTNCNFTLAKLDGCRLHDVQFIECKIIGTEFFKCDRTFFSLSFKKCLLQYCNFSDLIMKKTSFSGSKLQECHFKNTYLNNANFNDVDLSGTIFHNCDLSMADFSSAIHYNIDPQTNKIKKAKFSLPEVIGLLRGFDITIM